VVAAVVEVVLFLLEVVAVHVPCFRSVQQLDQEALVALALALDVRPNMEPMEEHIAVVVAGVEEDLFVLPLVGKVGHMLVQVVQVEDDADRIVVAAVALVLVVQVDVELHIVVAAVALVIARKLVEADHCSINRSFQDCEKKEKEWHETRNRISWKFL
jgi:hypothetical protein